MQRPGDGNDQDTSPGLFYSLFSFLLSGRGRVFTPSRPPGVIEV
jgi:hypothetical protein